MPAKKSLKRNAKAIQTKADKEAKKKVSHPVNISWMS